MNNPKTFENWLIKNYYDDLPLLNDDHLKEMVIISAFNNIGIGIKHFLKMNLIDNYTDNKAFNWDTNISQYQFRIALIDSWIKYYGSKINKWLYNWDSGNHALYLLNILKDDNRFNGKIKDANCVYTLFFNLGQLCEDYLNSDDKKFKNRVIEHVGNLLLFHKWGSSRDKLKVQFNLNQNISLNRNNKTGVDNKSISYGDTLAILTNNTWNIKDESGDIFYPYLNYPAIHNKKIIVDIAENINNVLYSIILDKSSNDYQNLKNCMIKNLGNDLKDDDLFTDILNQYLGKNSNKSLAVRHIIDFIKSHTNFMNFTDFQNCETEDEYAETVLGTKKYQKLKFYKEELEKDDIKKSREYYLRKKINNLQSDLLFWSHCLVVNFATLYKKQNEYLTKAGKNKKYTSSYLIPAYYQTFIHAIHL